MTVVISHLSIRTFEDVFGYKLIRHRASIPSSRAKAAIDFQNGAGHVLGAQQERDALCNVDWLPHPLDGEHASYGILTIDSFADGVIENGRLDRSGSDRVDGDTRGGVVEGCSASEADNLEDCMLACYGKLFLVSDDLRRVWLHSMCLSMEFHASQQSKLG